MKTVQNSADSSPRTTVPGWRRNLPMKQFDLPLAAADVQGAVVEKGIEVMGQMVDKQLQIIDEAQQKAEDFLKKEVRSKICKKKKGIQMNMTKDFCRAIVFMRKMLFQCGTNTKSESPTEVKLMTFRTPVGCSVFMVLPFASLADKTGYCSG